MAYHLNEVIEVVDLTDDSYIEKTNKLLIPDDVEEEHPPLIYNLDDDSDDESENRDYIRIVPPKEQSQIERHGASNGTRSPKGRYYILEFKHLGFMIKKGSDLELNGQEFFRAIKLYRDSNGMIQMQGILLVRARMAQNFLPKKMNELCAVITARADNGCALPNVDEYLTTRPISAIVCPRQIIFSNQLFPAHSFREKGIGYETW